MSYAVVRITTFGEDYFRIKIPDPNKDSENAIRFAIFVEKTQTVFYSQF